MRSPVDERARSMSSQPCWQDDHARSACKLGPAEVDRPRACSVSESRLCCLVRTQWLSNPFVFGAEHRGAVNGKRGRRFGSVEAAAESKHLTSLSYRLCPMPISRTSAFWRIAPSLRFISFKILATGVLLLECAFRSRMFSLVQATRLLRPFVALRFTLPVPLTRLLAE